jgi:hypothetical protein
MRIASNLAAATLACGLAFGAGHTANIVYVDGNLTGVTRQSSGALAYSGAEALELKAGLATLMVPYSGIAKAGLSAPQQHSSDVPLYKVWELRKHFSKTETQLLTVDFKDDQGDAKTMTLELGPSSASMVLNAIKEHNPSVETTALAPAEPQLISRANRATKHKPSKAEAKAPEPQQSAESAKAGQDKPEWWGDRYWKTGSNADKWEKSSANAPE